MRFWGARYSRTWFTTLVALPLLAGAWFSVLGGTGAWAVLVPLAAVLVAAVWAVPQAVVRDDGILLVVRARLVPWSDIAEILDPEPGDEDMRVRLVEGGVIRLDGVPPRAAPRLRARLAERRSGR